MQKRNTVKQTEPVTDEPATINVNTTRENPKPRRLSVVSKLCIVLLVMIILFFVGVSQGWFSANVRNTHVFEVVRDYYNHEEEVHPVLLPPTTTKPPQFWNVSVIVSGKSSHLVDTVKKLLKTTTNTFRVQVLVNEPVTNATLSKLRKYSNNMLLVNSVKQQPATGDTLLIIPENLSLSGTSKTWLSEMSSQFKTNRKLIALGTRVLYKSESTPRYIYSSGLDVAFRKIDTPVLFHRYEGLNEFDERAMTKQTNEQVLFGNVGLTAVSRFGMMVKNDVKRRRLLFQEDTVEHLLSAQNDVNHDRILCLKAVEKHPEDAVIMYLPIRNHAFVVDIEHITDNSKHLQPDRTAPIKDESLITLMKSIVRERLGLYADVRLAWDFGAGSCTGWFMEAVNFVTALESRIPIRIITGKDDMCEGLPGSVIKSLDRLIDRTFENITIFITHKPPERYPKFPYNGLVSIAGLPEYVIGRSMYESTAIPDGWGESCNTKVDEVWVPSKFLIQAFVEGGTRAEKVFLIPEPIDHYFYDPKITDSILEKSNKFNFLAVFKWEERKAPQRLLEAYFKEFENEKDVTLHLLTYLFGEFNGHSKERIMEKVMEVAQDLNMTNVPLVNVISQVIDTVDMPRLYKSMDAFVLPSRGEGWGMPYMEAMTMALPTIATNFGGQLEFMNNENSYLIDVKMEAVSAYDKREQWANANIADMRKKMRFVFDNKKEAKAVGVKAREHIVIKFSQQALADTILKNVKRILGILEIKRKDPKWLKERKDKLEKSKEREKKDSWGWGWNAPSTAKKASWKSWDSPVTTTTTAAPSSDDDDKPVDDNMVFEEFMKRYEKMFAGETNVDKLKDFDTEKLLQEVRESLEKKHGKKSSGSSTTSKPTPSTTRKPSSVTIKIN